MIEMKVRVNPTMDYRDKAGRKREALSAVMKFVLLIASLSVTFAFFIVKEEGDTIKEKEITF